MWDTIFWGTNLSIYVMIPFSFFYQEVQFFSDLDKNKSNQAEGLWIMKKSRLSKCNETLLVLLLVSFVFAGVVFVVCDISLFERESDSNNCIGHLVNHGKCSRDHPRILLCVTQSGFVHWCPACVKYKSTVMTSILTITYH